MPGKSSTSKKLISLKETSRILNVHSETLRRWDNCGKLKAVRVGSRKDRKYRAPEIVEALEKMK